MRNSRLGRRLDSCLLAAGVVAALAQMSGRAAPAQTPAQTPTFRAGVSLVTVDFMAVTADGKPVSDLKAEEVTVKVDGKTKKLQSLQHIAVADPPSEANAGFVPPPTPFGSNAITEAGRSIILVLDDETLRPGKEQPLKDAVSRFLNTLSSRDRLSVVTVPHGSVKTDLTNDHDRIRQIVNQITGQAPREESGSEAACRSRLTLQALTGLLESLRVGESPMTVVFFSTSLVAPRRDAPLTLAPGMCELTTEVFQQVGTAAAGARAHFYIIQPDDVILPGGANVSTGSLLAVENIAGTGFTGSDNPRAGLEHLGGVTGGPLMHLTASGEGAMSRVARETAGFYLAAYEPDPSDRNGLTHGVDIRVSRPGVVVRGRPQIVIAKPDPRATGALPPPTPLEMLKDVRTFRELPLRAAAFASRVTGDDSQLKILAIAEPAEPNITLTSVSAGLFDATGRLRASWAGDRRGQQASGVRRHARTARLVSTSRDGR